MICDKYFHLYGKGKEMLFEEIKLPIKRGKWTHGDDMPPMKYKNGKPIKFWECNLYCSSCGHEAYCDTDWGDQLFDFCPYCGAKMEDEE